MAEVTRVLESAIPPQLQTERTIPASTPENYMPPFPAYVARFPKEAKDLVMSVIGCQNRAAEPQGPGYQKLVKLINDDNKSKPRYWEAASVTDNRGHLNQVVIAYWQTKAEWDQWKVDSGFDTWWSSLEPGADQNGWFLEVFLPSMDRFETIFSDNEVPEGAANIRDGVSGEVEQHVYWGSMRDRMAASQTDPLAGERGSLKSASTTDTSKKRIKVSGRKNLAMIRSGQDWSATTPHERKLYLETMHPVLVRGMDFLHDEGKEVGCIDCRFMTCNDKKSGADQERTFGLAYFEDLSELEGWSKKHKTHLDIFGRFLQYAAELQNQVSLRLFHEVMVLKPEQQFFEYIGCHDTTGMLASV